MGENRQDIEALIEKLLYADAADGVIGKDNSFHGYSFGLHLKR